MVRVSLQTILYEVGRVSPSPSLGTVRPASALPVTYNPVTHFRTSPDIESWRDADGIWWKSPGLRDESQSPKEDFTRHNFYYM